MNRKIALTVLALVLAFSPAFAEDQAPVDTTDIAVQEELTGSWWYGRTIDSFSFEGLQNVQTRTLTSLLRPYVGQVFTEELENEIINLLYAQTWLEYVEGFDMQLDPVTGAMNVTISLHEIAMIDDIVFNGNDEISDRVLLSEQGLQEGDFFSPGLLRANASMLQTYYQGRGFADALVNAHSEIDEADNTVRIVYTISEGLQYKVRSINFIGISAMSEKDLKREMSSKERSFFRSGNFVASKMDQDMQTLLAFYNDNGYIDAVVQGYTVEDVTEPDDKYHMVAIDITISEGSQWLLGSITFEGNTVFSDEDIQKVIYMKSGVVHDQSEVLAQIQAVASLYYNDGYIQTAINPVITRDEESHLVNYNLVITESEQSVIERIVITGLTKTKPYVIERELELHVGDVFSQAALQASGQNILNTGIVTDISTGLYQGETENGVILEIAVEEGNQMQLQFGATFGGTVDGFPVSGFLQWSDTNIFGTGRDFAITTNLSPDTQAVSLSLSDSWVGNKRWSNGISFSIERSSYDNVLQRGTESAYYDGRDKYNVTYPLGFESNAAWRDAGMLTSASVDLMSYDFYTFSIGYSTGYTFNFRPGNLTLSAGLSIGLSHAIYDDSYDPYEALIMKYHDKWQFSNKLSMSITWDGRDLVTNTTRGYLLSASYTYAGGFLGGLSNYNRLGFSAAGYVPLFTYTNDENKSSSLVLSGTTSLSLMLPQFWNNTYDHGWDVYSPFDGATRYEMLYLDGMNTGRGFSVQLYKSLLWHNQIELSYPIVRNILNFEVFISADGAIEDLEELNSFGDLNWYFGTGFGIKLRIPGFPLGLYWVKNATWDKYDDFQLIDNSILGGSIVLAITTSIY